MSRAEFEKLSAKVTALAAAVEMHDVRPPAAAAPPPPMQPSADARDAVVTPAIVHNPAREPAPLADPGPEPVSKPEPELNPEPEPELEPEPEPEPGLYTCKRGVRHGGRLSVAARSVGMLCFAM